MTSTTTSLMDSAPRGFLSVRGVSNARLSSIDLDVGRGECVALMGPSGAGKSLLLRQIADLDPGEGQVSLDGVAREQTPAPQWRRQVVYCPAEPGWWDDQVRPHFVGHEQGATEALPLFGLPPHVMEAAVHTLSTGERQRLGLLRALLRSPRVLLLDEPTASLDAASSAQVETELRRRIAGGLTVLLVTHSEDQARRLASRVLRLAAGRLEGSRP